MAADAVVRCAGRGSRSGGSHTEASLYLRCAFARLTPLKNTSKTRVKHDDAGVRTAGKDCPNEPRSSQSRGASEQHAEAKTGARDVLSPHGSRRDAWTHWLGSQAWDCFATLTVRYANPSQRQLRRAAERLHGAVGSERFFWVCERGAHTGRAHLHGLLFGVDPQDVWTTWRKLYRVRNPEWERWRQELFLRPEPPHWLYPRAHTERYDPQQGANGYVGKYLTKAQTDYDFLTCPESRKTKS